MTVIMVSKVLIVLCLMATSSFADKEPLHKEAFEDGIMFIRNQFLAAGVMSGQLYNMSSDANDAAAQGYFGVWGDMRHVFDEQIQAVAAQYELGKNMLWALTQKIYELDVQTEKCVNTIDKCGKKAKKYESKDTFCAKEWAQEKCQKFCGLCVDGPGGFSDSGVCVQLYNFVKEHSSEDWEFDFTTANALGAAHAMEEDIKCFQNIFEGAENIPDEDSGFWDDTSLEAAYDLVVEIHKKAFRVRTASTRFHRACMAVEMAEQKWNAAHPATDADMDKRETSLMKRLLILRNENTKK